MSTQEDLISSSKKIEDYALLSDCYSSALVGRDGSVDWLTFPRFDSPSIFTALLGSEENGHWKISPTTRWTSRRKYIDGSMVLETVFETEKGSCKLVDCLVYGEKDPTLLRSVEGIEGEVTLSLDLKFRFDYGRIVPWVRRSEDDPLCLLAVAGPDAICFKSSVPIKPNDHSHHSEFTIRKNEKKEFTLTWFPSHQDMPVLEYRPGKLLERTLHFWDQWCAQCKYTGFDQHSVHRSLTVLKALTYLPTGAIIAAPTTSLPEKLGGSRNWDYRYSWLRDSSFALMALLKAGYRDEAIAWKQWLLRAVAGTPDQTNIMYGIMGERRLPEMELPWLAGYEGSKPVRIGNAAHDQFQLDVFGEVLSASLIGRKEGIQVNDRNWAIERELVKYVSEHWTKPDEGIWEVRSQQQQFVHSKLMAWEALNCAITSARDFSLPGDVEKWIELRDRIHRDICEKGFDPKQNSFVQAYGSKELDASLLMMTRVDFLPANDPRIIGTVKAIQENLMVDGLVLRYQPESGVDGISEAEGCFLPCTFWMVDNLRLLGRKEEARELYRYVSSLKNDLGLFSEEYDIKNKRMIGNFPQGFTHIAHAVSAMGIEEKTDTDIS